MYKNNDSCLVCGSKVGIEYLNLGDQPLANSYHHGEKLERFPLRMRLCTNCWHSQLSVSVDPAKMFEHYLYISDTSQTLKSYFEWVTDYILLKTSPKRVLEIACNSGLLLEMFKNKGIESVGVDPAKNIRELSEKRGLDVYVDYWDEKFSHKLKEEKGTFDLVMGFHVLPHVQDPNDFIKSCVNVLSEDGTIFLQTSQCDMLLNNEFDVIYHEHSSYFTGNSIRALARNHGLYVSSIIKTAIHSKSFLFSLQRKPCNEIELINLINLEEGHGIYTVDKYKEFAHKAEEIKTKLLTGLSALRNEGYMLIGYGAAAKGNTLLNFIDYQLDLIIDDSYLKWDYLTPGQNIKITSIDLLKNHDLEKIAFIPLAWNFYKEIKERIEKVRDTKNDVFVKYFPDYKEEK